MKRVLKGKIVSDKSEKTVVVLVDTIKTHPIYKKKFKLTKKFIAHSEEKNLKIGDIVEIEETRPLSARKRWQVRKNPGDKK